MTALRPTAPFLVSLLLSGSVAAQGLVVSTSSDVAASDGFVLKRELHRKDAAGRRPALPLELLNLYVGDADGDLGFDDAPTDVDAAHWTGAADPEGWLLSVTANFNAPGAGQILDGDVFRFTATGVQVVYPEAFFQSVTGTSTIDVDAFAIGPFGELYFSFAEDEPTTSATLAAANGGATLDEQCVFAWFPGATTATLRFTPPQVVALFNHAYGTNATSVVDVQGLEIDPDHAGELLITTASTAAAFVGQVITSFGGGLPFVMNGAAVGPAAFDFASAVALDALAFVPTPAPPLLRTSQQVVSVNTSTLVTLRASGYAPSEAVQFLVSDAALPRPVFAPATGVGGYGATPLDLLSPVFALSLTSPELTRTADAAGVATFVFASQGLPPFVEAVVQTFGFTSATLSTPIALSLLP